MDAFRAVIAFNIITLTCILNVFQFVQLSNYAVVRVILQQRRQRARRLRRIALMSAHQAMTIQALQARRIR